MCTCPSCDEGTAGGKSLPLARGRSRSRKCKTHRAVRKIPWGDRVRGGAPGASGASGAPGASGASGAPSASGASGAPGASGASGQQIDTASRSRRS
eukprot:5059077-Prymnesium_polylepis.1